jgi:hypothetical protein
MRDFVLMHQLKVFKCDICHAPFLFENNLEDHKREHEPATPFRLAGSSIDKKRSKGAKAKRKQKAPIS